MLPLFHTEITTSDLTAVDTSDYTGQTDVAVPFPANTPSVLVSIVTTADTFNEHDEQFQITLDDPTPAGTSGLGELYKHVVNIKDNDRPGKINYLFVCLPGRSLRTHA